MYNNNDYGNILMIIYLSSLRHAHAAGRPLVTPRSKALKAFSKESDVDNLCTGKLLIHRPQVS